MKKLIVVRHGAYSSDGEYLNEPLSSVGRKQVFQLAEKLMAHINGSSVVILSSSALRASQTAEIISETLCAPFKQHDLLWSGEGGKAWGEVEDCQKVLELFDGQKNGHDVVILVTHYEYVEKFPRFFAKVKLGVALQSDVIDKGTAWLVDCEKKELQHIR